MTWICPECEYENDEDLIRCICGHEVSDDQIAIQENTVDSNETSDQTIKIIQIPWVYFLHLFVSIGGGALGVVFILIVHVQSPDSAYLIGAILVCFYAYGIFAGIRLMKGIVTKYLSVFYLMQIPILSSPFFAYQFASGFLFSGTILENGFNGSWRIGCRAHILINPSFPWGAGINFFAVFMIYLLVKRVGLKRFTKLEANIPKNDTKGNEVRS